MMQCHYLTASVFIISVCMLMTSVTPTSCLEEDAKKICEKTRKDDVDKVVNGNEIDADWFKDCVDKYYCLQPHDLTAEEKKNFLKPMFKDQMNTENFKDTAARIERFFKRNKNWEQTKKNPIYTTIKDGKTDDSRLLAITDARYLYVIHLLYQLSDNDNKLKGCVEIGDKTKVPTGVCFPRPYGSANPTSDYDVGLVGKKSGELTAMFNVFFEDKKAGFGIPSEQVFDTNIYAFTLEYSMPSLYSGLAIYFSRELSNLDLNPVYQMQELASANFKMFRFNPVYYTELDDDAKKTLTGGPQVHNRKGFYVHWIEYFLKWDNNKKKEWANNGNDIRSQHNLEYSKLVIEAQADFNTGFNDLIKVYMSEMSIALIYAAEAYHTRGAIRHVVGWLQMKKKTIKENTMVMDYWVSMIENWADANKEYKLHCDNKNAVDCLVKMSKYLHRTFNATTRIDDLLSNIKPANVIKSLRTGDYKELIAKFPKASATAEYLKSSITKIPQEKALYWAENFRNKPDSKPNSKPNFIEHFKPFLDSISNSISDGQVKSTYCQNQAADTPLKPECMGEIQKLIFKINHLLLVLTKQSSTDKFLLLMKGGVEKSLN